MTSWCPATHKRIEVLLSDADRAFLNGERDVDGSARNWYNKRNLNHKKEG